MNNFRQRKNPQKVQYNLLYWKDNYQSWICCCTCVQTLISHGGQQTDNALIKWKRHPTKKSLAVCKANPMYITRSLLATWYTIAICHCNTWSRYYKLHNYIIISEYIYFSNNWVHLQLIIPIRIVWASFESRDILLHIQIPRLIMGKSTTTSSSVR